MNGSAGRPRLCVFRSRKGIYAQLIDDDAGVTLASASTLSLGGASGTKSERAAEVGKFGSQSARDDGIDKQAVGEITAQIRGVRPPEPYKGKGIRYAGEAVRRKVGKRA